MEEGQEAMSAHITALYAILVVFLVVGSGLMSGLTLGLLSLDVMDLEVGLHAEGKGSAGSSGISRNKRSSSTNTTQQAAHRLAGRHSKAGA